MNIILSGDDNYAPYMATTILNVMENIYANTKVQFLILDSGISKERINTLKQWVQTIPNTSIKIRDVLNPYKNELSNISRYNHGQHISNGAYALFFVAEIFPEYNKALYLDVDIYIKKSLETLYKTKINDKYAAVIRSTNNSYYGKYKKTERSNLMFNEYFKKHFGLDNTQYFNAGFQLLNLKKLRQHKVKDRLVEALTNIPLKTFKECIEYHNQDIFNAIFYNKVKHIHPRYNINLLNKKDKLNGKQDIPTEYRKEVQEAFEDPAIVHYSGEKKLWNNKDLQYAKEWWNLSKLTPFHKEMKRKFFCNTSWKQKFNLFFRIKWKHNIKIIRLFSINLLKKYNS